MKIFDEEEVDKVSKEHARKEFAKECTVNKLGLFDQRIYTAFTTGVEYAESKVEDLCIEFATFIENHFITAISSGKKYINFHEEDDLDFTSDPNRYSLEEVFQQFLTQRNGK